MPPGSVYVGRPSPFGNPYTIKGCLDVGYATEREDAARQCVAAFRSWLTGIGGFASDPDIIRSSVGQRSYDRREIHARLHELAGRDLVCWCGPDRPCHADILLELAGRPS